MPVGAFKNALYGAALPLVGKRCEWTARTPVEHILHKHHTVGACIQRFEAGKLMECLCVGTATPDTIFRTASIAKMVTALLVFRLQTLGKLNVNEDISDLWGRAVRNPQHPDAPITLGMLLSHTSSLADSPAYFASFTSPAALDNLLSDPAAYSAAQPGATFRYSNFAAGLVGCLLERRFGQSLEALAQEVLFAPFGVKATYDLSKADGQCLTSSYRVLPVALAFDSRARSKAAKPLDAPDAQHHYLLASGSLYLTATDLAKLTLLAWNGADGFLNDESLRQLQAPLLGWPEQAVPMRHGMGLFKLEGQDLWGHQGFAYGAVNGVFFDAQGNGFAMLNSGTSERRVGHLALVNRDLLRHWRML